MLTKTGLQFISFIIAAGIFSSCSATADSSGNRNSAALVFGNDYKVIYNSDSTFLVAKYSLALTEDKKGEDKTKPPFSPLKFKVYSLDKEKIIFEDNLPNGETKWLNDHQIKVTTVPGIVKGKEDENPSASGYIYDVKLEKKISWAVPDKNK